MIMMEYQIGQMTIGMLMVSVMRMNYQESLLLFLLGITIMMD